MQLFRQPKAIYLASGSLVTFGLIPGLPTMPFLFLGAMFGVVGKIMSGKVKAVDDEESRLLEEEDVAPESSEESHGSDIFITDSLELELGYGLLPLVDEKRNGDLLQRISKIRSQIGSELGIVVHPVRVRDNLQLDQNQYVLKLKGVEIARSDLFVDKLLAMNATGSDATFGGTSTVEPAFQLPALWIDPGMRSAAEMEGFTVVEPSAVLTTHLSEVVRNHADELLSRQDVKDMCETVREFAPSLIEDLVPDKVPINVLHNVLRSLLHERIPVKDIVTILEILANQGVVSTDVMIEKVREGLRRTISSMYLEPDGHLHVISLHPNVERVVSRAAQDSDSAGTVMLDPAFAQQFLEKLESTLHAAYRRGTPPVLLVPTPIRMFIKRLVEPTFGGLAVIGYTEVTPQTKIKSAGTVVTKEVSHAHEASA
jgi:flagellar biosynthesis protein FlhA